MIEITRGDNNTFSITQDGETTVYSAVFFAKSKSQSVYLFAKYAHPGFSFGARYDEITVGGVSYASAAEVVAALSEFVGSFKSGGGAPSPTPLQAKEVQITANGTTEVTPDAGFGGLSKVTVETDVQGGSSDALVIASDEWAEADLPEELQTGTLYVKASAGRLYIGSSVVNSGIWMFDKATGVFTKIWATGYNWQYWFEASNGDVYASSSNTSTGILKVAGSTVTQIYTVGYTWQYWFEASNGDVYASSTNANAGTLKVAGSTATQVYTVGCQYWFEASNGDVYASSTNANAGILKVAGSTVTQIYTTGYNWQHWFEASNGDVYASSSSTNTGILKVAGSTVTQIYTTGYYWRNWFETSNGDVYVSCSYNTGILKVAGSTVTQVYTTGYNWQYWFEASNGDVYASSGSTNTTGILKVAGSTVTQVQKTGYAYNQRNGDLLICGANSSFYPFDMSTERPVEFSLFGTLIGQWVLSPSIFSKVTKQLPTTSYIPKKYVASVAPVVDTLGNVFVVGSGSVIYSKNPIAV